MGKCKRAGLSNAVNIDCSVSFAEQTSLQGPKDLPIITRQWQRVNRDRKQLELEQQEYNMKLAALSFADRHNLIAQDINMANGNQSDDNNMSPIAEAAPGFLVPPPGDEGFFCSHEGGEVILQDLFMDTLRSSKKKDY
ncbi:hypothetical protein NLJ89_g11987 [Agrocybe chaxingu]|uniref:Uncharacterized protein n=1 Tax=Agrocybe chaxingu TaxID=84603 RepID=A0A9W8JMQ8_9AGAR|nr:hypothetical protein NLJ89_g11987 [Agrocybe chaxingu]